MRLISALLVLLITSSSHAEDMGWLTRLLAKEAAYTLMQNMSLMRAEGYTWDTILGEHLPNQINEACGYRERTGFDARLSPAVLDATKRVFSGALTHSYTEVFSRPGAQIHLFDDKTKDNEDIIISLRVVPSLKEDPWLNLIYRMGDEGAVVLCDIGQDDQGGLKTIGKEILEHD